MGVLDMNEINQAALAKSESLMDIIKCNSTLRFSALVAGLFFMMVRDAEAYIDPGSTSYFFQLLIAGLTALVFFFSSLKRRVAGLFKSIFKKNDSDQNAELNPGKPTPPES